MGTGTESKKLTVNGQATISPELSSFLADLQKLLVESPEALFLFVAFFNRLDSLIDTEVVGDPASGACIDIVLKPTERLMFFVAAFAADDTE